MHKFLTFLGMLLLIADVFPDTTNVGALIIPYVRRHQRYPFRRQLQRLPIIFRAAADSADTYRDPFGRTMLTTVKRSQPDTDFDYTDYFDPAHVFH